MWNRLTFYHYDALLSLAGNTMEYSNISWILRFTQCRLCFVVCSVDFYFLIKTFNVHYHHSQVKGKGNVSRATFCKNKYYKKNVMSGPILKQLQKKFAKALTTYLARSGLPSYGPLFMMSQVLQRRNPCLTLQSVWFWFTWIKELKSQK